MSDEPLIEKWHTNPWSEYIKPVLVDCETEASVYIGKRRCAKRSQTGNYFDSWKDAHEHMLDVAQRDADHARRRLDYTEIRLKMISALEPPKEERSNER